MKLNHKATALIYSQNQIAEVIITEMVGNNKYLADYQGTLCAAMFNPFTGMFYVDDVHGKFPNMSPEEMDDALYELRFLGESSERQLNAYRSLGSLKHLKRLRDEEIRRIRNWNRFKRISLVTFFGTGFFMLLWVFISGIVSILA